MIAHLREEKTFDRLIGKTITQVQESQDDSMIRFIDKDGIAYTYYAEADCCSESYFWGFENPESATSIVRAVKQQDADKSPPSTKQEVDLTEKWIITTDAGDFSFFYDKF